MSKHFVRLWAAGLGVAGIVLIPSAVTAQRLADLQQGARIRVATHSYGDFTGTLESATSDTIRLRDNRQTLAFSVADTKGVSTSAGPSPMRGMLRTGAMSGVIGSIVGAGVGAMTYKPCKLDGVFDCAFVPNSRARATTFAAISFGVSSLVIGGVVGAIRGSDSWTPVTLH